MKSIFYMKLLDNSFRLTTRKIITDKTNQEMKHNFKIKQIIERYRFYVYQ